MKTIERLQNNKLLLLLSSFLFFSSFAITFIFIYFDFNSQGMTIKNDLSFSKHPTIFFFIKNNLSATFFLFLGSVVFSIPTVVQLIFLGVRFGIGSSYILKNTSVKINEILALTLPHGIFEILAMIIAGAAGFKIPYEIIRYLAGKKETILTREDIKEYLTLALISIILIVIAAFVEAYITPRIAEYFLLSPVE
ncbi:MAG TPA: stage II sporulation protein M [Arcobacter sp.]|nr:stage II sporulation protein M [Arcobacter sp.]